jgi:hypothetical protein
MALCPIHKCRAFCLIRAKLEVSNLLAPYGPRVLYFTIHRSLVLKAAAATWQGQCTESVVCAR